MSNPTPNTDNHLFVDPVCGMSVDPKTAAAKSMLNGVDIYFCAQGCKAAFDANPNNYVREKPKGFWRRYLDRLNKATGGKPPTCCH
jgi:YHS domain-containing protein